jgi:hypothetical protein
VQKLLNLEPDRATTMNQSQIAQGLTVAINSVRPLTRWYLDLLRNVLVVAAFLYVAAKSQNQFLDGLAIFSKLVLSIHCMTYFWPFLDKIPSMRFIGSPGWRTRIDAVIGALGSGIIYGLFNRFYEVMMSQLVQAQGFR